MKKGRKCKVAQASSPDQCEYDGVGIERKQGPCHNLDQQNVSTFTFKLNSKKKMQEKSDPSLKIRKLPEEYFPIFNFSAVRQVGGEGNAESKAKPELSPTTTKPTNFKSKVSPKPKPRTAHSSQKNKSKSQPNFRFKPISEFFTNMKTETQIIGLDGQKTPPTT